MSVLTTGDRWIGLAHAKVNLFLYVGPKLPNGYHEILSLIVPIQLSDEVTIRVRRGRGSKLKLKQLSAWDWLKLPNLEENFIWLAYKWLTEREDNLIGNRWIEVLLLKRIPMRAGLGGGSADLAFFSKFLRHRLRIPDKLIREMLTELSTDAIAMYTDLPAIVSGVGDKVKPLSSLKLNDYSSEELQRDLKKALGKYWVLIVFPDFEVSTGSAYRWIDEDLPERVIREEEVLTSFTSNLRKGNLSLHNDFEEVVMDRYPQLRSLKDDLQMFSDLVLLSGSGSSVIALLDNLEDLEVTQRMVERKYGYKTIITSFLI